MFILIGLFGVFLTLLVLPVYLHKSYVKKHEKYLKNISGPKPNPFFGNMLDFVIPTHKFMNLFSDYMDKYGTITKVYDGPQSTFLLVADENLFEYILSSPQLIEKASQYEYLQNWLGLGLLTSTGLKWKKRRRVITPAFHFSILENFVDIFERVGDVFIKKLETHIEEEKVDIYPLITLYALDIICEAAMGISVNAQLDNKSQYVRSVEEICRIITDRNFSPLDTRFYPFTINYYKEKMALKVLHAHTDTVIDRRIKEMKNCVVENNENDVGIKKKMAFLDTLLNSNCDGKPLSRTDIREEVDTFMFEGHHTISSAISFALYSLANNPSVQKKALEEQKEIFGDLKSAKPIPADLQDMKYLELVIKETLRLYPSVPFFGRNVTEDFEWGS
ncbi:unnamed protein product [Psylliodes chrysocephalus]|uniref:Cytochrome P450 n=1 Tax=Psylliodes chrysocephalus TaxID=3402493 RepID=A0A9P0D239_9CUCU|nr:unnamed protein product [Psylliodes chrysocephala]